MDLIERQRLLACHVGYVVRNVREELAAYHVVTVEYDVVVSAVPLIEVGGEDGAGNAVLAVEVVRKVVAVVVGLYYYVVYRRDRKSVV